MSGPGATDKKETEARAAGWTNLEYWFNLPPAGADGQPVLVTSGAAVQPGDVYIQVVEDYRANPMASDGGTLTRGRGPDHFVGEVRGLSFCKGWGPLKACFDAYGLSHNPETSQLFLNGHYSGVGGSFIEVFGGEEVMSQPLLSVFPYGVTKEGALICEAGEGGPFAHFAAQMNHPPAQQGLVDSKFWEQGYQWLEGVQKDDGRDGLCTPEGVEVHLPSNPLDLVKEMRSRGLAEVVFADPQAPVARMVLPKGASVVFLNGKNEVGVDWQLVRNPDGSLQGYGSVATEAHMGEVVVPKGLSWKGEVAGKSLTVAEFSPITLVKDLLTFLFERPSDLITKIFHSSETKITGPVTLTLPGVKKEGSKEDPKPVTVTLTKGRNESVLNVFSTIKEGISGEALAQDMTITKACWDFGNIQTSVDPKLNGALGGCFQGSVQVKASFSGRRLVTLSIDFKGKWDGLDFPLWTPLGYQRTTFSGNMTGSITFTNLETDPTKASRLAFSQDSHIQLVDGQLTIHPKGAKDYYYDINPQDHVKVELKNGLEGIDLAVGPLAIHDFVVTPHLSFSLRDTEDKPIAWEECSIDGVKGRCLPLEKIANPILRSIIDIAGSMGKTTLIIDYALKAGETIHDNFGELDMSVFNPFRQSITAEPKSNPVSPSPSTDEYEEKPNQPPPPPDTKQYE